MILSVWQVVAVFGWGMFYASAIWVLIFIYVRRKVMEALFSGFLQELEGVAIKWFAEQAEAKVHQVNTTIAGAAQKAAQVVHDKFVAATDGAAPPQA